MYAHRLYGLFDFWVVNAIGCDLFREKCGQPETLDYRIAVAVIVLESSELQ
jgi:hypothetical protein